MGKRVSYVLRTGGAKSKRLNIVDGEVAFSDAKGTSQPVIKHFAHVDGGSITIATANLQGGKPFTFNISKPYDANVFSLLIPISGSSRLSFWNGAGRCSDSKHFDILATPTDGEAQFIIYPNQAFQSVGVEFSESARLGAIEEVRLPSRLATIAKGRFPEPEMTKITMTPAIKRIAMEIMSNPFHGLAGKYYSQAKAMELMAVFISMIDETRAPHQSRFGIQDRRKIFEARDVLMLNISNPPSLMELAKSAGINYKKLNRGFREFFGMTVHAFVIDARLELARQSIAIEGLTVSQAAGRFGYSHVSNFSTAFKRKFGCTPGGNG